MCPVMSGVHSVCVYMHIYSVNGYMWISPVCLLVGFVSLASDCEEELSNCGIS